MIGLIVNPIAGLGGSVGLKGTDGPEVAKRAAELGAMPLAADRAKRALSILAGEVPDLAVLSAEDPMGSQCLAGLPFAVEIIPATGPSSPRQTALAAKAMAERDVRLILFAGGDGTARDIVAEIGLDCPVLGIPCGVKMHSGVFAVTPEAAGRLVADLYRSDQERVGFRKVEIMDIDEAQLRHGRIAAELYGYARAPHSRRLLQAAKRGPAQSSDLAVAGASADIIAEMDDESVYLIGPGTSAKGVLDSLGLESTLLGLDAVQNRSLIGRDLSQRDALALCSDHDVRIVVGVTGQQGFVFGRGNQQIGIEAIRRAGREGLIIIASPEKLSELAEPVLRVDTGDPDLDQSLAGHYRVRVGPRRTMMMRLGI